MDLNFQRAKREKAIALEVAQQFLREITSTEEAAPPELLVHHFALVIERLGVKPADATEAMAARVLGYTLKIIRRKRREIDRISDEVERATQRVITSLN